MTVKLGSKSIETGKRTLIMGILNVTPDSFSDGGSFFDEESIARGIDELIKNGADIIDVGGESTRPGYTPVDADEEIRRISPALDLLRSRDVIVSVDTSKARVAEFALDKGCDIINDVTALYGDNDMASLCGRSACGVVLMYNRRLQEDTTEDVLADARRFLAGAVKTAVDAGVSNDSIIIDPGIGFGTTREEEILLTKYLAEINPGDYPILYACSRKRLTGEFASNMEERDSATAALSVMSVSAGADIVRVHNPGLIRPAIKAADALYRG